MLPKNATATDVIDLLADRVIRLVDEVNASRDLTREQFAACFERAFSRALPVFLTSLERDRPDLADRLRDRFLDEHAEWLGVAAAGACTETDGCGAPAGVPCDPHCLAGIV